MSGLEKLLRNGRRIRERIALDIDGVIADFLPVLIDEYNRTHPHDVKYSIDGANGTKKWPPDWSMEDFFDMYHQVWNKRNKDIAALFDPALLEELTHYYDVDIVSFRGNRSDRALRKWLERNGLSKFNVVSGAGLDKAALDYDIYIDDAGKLARKIEQSSDKFIFLVDDLLLYNRGVLDGPNVKRVGDVNAAFKILISIAKAKDARLLSKSAC